MALAQTDRAILSPAQGVTPALSARFARVQPAALGVAVVEAVIGYEWLLSALDKILSPTFRSGLAKQVAMNMQGNPNTWWVALARSFVLPHAQLCALLAEVGELLVALGLFAGALLWASGPFPTRRWGRRLNLGVIGALLGGALMTANYYLMAGNTLPGLNPGAPFDEGLSLDGVLTLIAVGLLAIHVLPLWSRRARQEAAEAP
jgi:thiosulfate dehydrogenase [quinone] large subunit